MEILVKGVKAIIILSFFGDVWHFLQLYLQKLKAFVIKCCEMNLVHTEKLLDGFGCA